MIPVIIPPFPDELFYSYLERLSRQNGFSNVNNFVGRTLNNISSSTKVYKLKWNYDGTGAFASFLQNTVQPHYFIENCSMYPFQSIFLTPNRQAMLVNLMFNMEQARNTWKMSPQ